MHFMRIKVYPSYELQDNYTKWSERSIVVLWVRLQLSLKNITVSWDVTTCSLVDIYERFEGTCSSILCI
jgi:hypothetical protein